MSDDLPFKVVRSNGSDELLALASNLVIAGGAFGAAAGMYPDDLIELRQGGPDCAEERAEAPAQLKIFSPFVCSTG